MTEDWQTLRTRALASFRGEPLGAQLETELIAAFAQHPEAVERATDKIIARYQAGGVTSPWGMLGSEVKRAITALDNPTTRPAKQREQAIARAESWLRTAGIHYDRWTEVQSELFDHERNPPGLLAAFDTPTLRERIETLWNDLRPAGELVEREAELRAEHWKQHSPTAKRLHAKLVPHIPEHQLDYTPPSPPDDPLPF